MHQNPASWDWLPVLDFPSHDHSYSMYCTYFIFSFSLARLEEEVWESTVGSLNSERTLLLKVRM